MGIDLRKVKVNVPKVRMEDYFITVSGNPKTGKTSLFAELLKKTVGVEKGLLLAFEPGYSALEVIAQDITDWYEFEDVVEQLIEHKDPNGEKLPYDFQWLCLDTVDMMWKLAEQHVLMLHNSDASNKKVKHVNHIGYGQGQVMVADLVHKAITKLIRAGYGIMAITHSKERKVEQRDGTQYDVLQLSLSNRAREIFVDLADFIVFLTVERERDVHGNVAVNRYMYFRSDGFVEAGSRFENVPEKIPYSVDGFIEVFENAVKSSLKDGMSVDDLKKEQTKKREAKAKEYAKIARTKPEDIIGEIDKKIEQLKKGGDTDKIQKFAEALKKEFGTPAYKQFDDVNQLQRVVELLDAVIAG